MIVAPTAPDRIILLAYKHLFNSLIENIPGIPIRSNLSDEDTENYAALVSQLAIKAHHVVRYQTTDLLLLHTKIIQDVSDNIDMNEKWR